ncbi:hypothetical protein [Catenulispora pinisilvae]|uniref:hypothetical protein n=1 Tax=Catenulispora pinisilvae TaxID=2705253 RepID=UPI00189234E0|nr:hypothetical protein [Catenulispora pinisilvae]
MLDIDFVDRLAVLAVARRSLALLCAMDEPWTAAHIVPGFDWSQADDPNHHRAEAAWQGFLTHPAWNGRVIGFLEPCFTDAFAGLEGKMRKAVVETVANIAVGAPAHDELIARLISVFISLASEDERKDWASTVGWLLGKISTESAETAWETWILDYRTRRLAGSPRSLAHDEAREMLIWIPTAGRHFPAAVDLLTETGTEFGAAYLFF